MSSTATKPRKTRRAPTVTDGHRDWLALVDADGPFLSVPTLKRVWPQGMPALTDSRRTILAEAKPHFEKAWENWDLNHDDAALELYRQARDSWVDTVLREVIGWEASYSTDLSGPDFAEVTPIHSPNRTVTVSATGGLAHGGLLGALTLVVDPVESLRDPLADGWSDSAIDRMTQLLLASRVSIGVVTDGRWWAVVYARPEASSASGIVDALTWTEEPATRNAFLGILSRRQLVGGVPGDRLPELFAESVKSAEEITEALGTQVRQAVELLVQALSEGALAVTDRGLPDPLPRDRSVVYEAAVTMMMRVVFLLFAEERGLLPQTTLFADGYGMSDELEALRRRAGDEGTEILDGTYLTWHRLLATSQALDRGATFEDIRIPSYGGSLFAPERFDFLLARDEQGLLIPISDRVMLAILEAVQVAVVKGIGSRISFRDIDVEQIGYIYEGLLGYTCATVNTVTVGLIGPPGKEAELPLSALESLAADHPTPAKLHTALVGWIKENQPAASAPSAAKLGTAVKAEVEDSDRALKAVTTDPAMQDRLRPFVGLIRRDLRNRPYVVQPGGVLVVETASRANAGAHYTPKELAEEVVRYALEPLVYSPGPHQTTGTWEPISSEAILDLKIADIACGSGAFLVAAARYLGDRLVEAWTREGTAEGNPNTLYTKAIRHVVARCLYGADINAMAVEMCKLSLWLVSLDPHLPFSFVDDKILHGNSLLGLTNAEQLRHQHIYPDSTQLMFSDIDIDGRLHEVARLRREIADVVDNNDPQRSASAKTRQLHRTQKLTQQLADIADGVMAAGLHLGGKPGKALNESYANLRIAIGMAYPNGDGESDRTMLDEILRSGLTPSVATDYERWKSLHWVLAVPDVMEHGGFDAIVGNPPFISGSDITGAMGTNVREWLVHLLANGKRGKADFVAYFFLRAVALLNRRGNVGLIATNTIAQTDTREVGLDQMVSSGFTITRSIQSRRWPSASATLEYAAVWGTVEPVAEGVQRVCDGVPVSRISTLLEPTGRIDAPAFRLLENSDLAFYGCNVVGMGFAIEPDVAAAWIEEDGRNADVLFPFINGKDLNSRPDLSAARWIIDFNGRSQAEAMLYPKPYDHVLRYVKPERMKKAKPARDAPWWLFLRAGQAMRKSISRFDDILAITRVSKTVMPVRINSGVVPSDAVVVFATNSYADQAVISSGIHQSWVIKYGSGMRVDPRYTPSDVFETFPRPTETEEVRLAGRKLEEVRREIMISRSLGLTDLYNLINDPAIVDSADGDVALLRQIHVDLDLAVMRAYSWEDVDLDYGFHTYRQMMRWTVAPAARVEILDRLLEENHRRAATTQHEIPALDVQAAEEGDE
ncbi:Eco57I restriction-modification methylase domain-containing protein [Nocardia brasiliensis]|uniref:Eco57I restriction-modification methylase domain-containing protein n=1 Tax=Nocardia brasiliensis TaxID=37326 RepID=UPI0033FFF83E